MCTCVRAFSIIHIHTVLISRAVFIHVRWNNFSETRLLWVYMCVSRKKSLVNVVGSSIMLLVNVSYVIDIDVTSLPKRWWNGHDRQDVRRELFASREFVREIHSRSFYNRLASINHRYIHSLPLSSSFLLVIGALYPDLRQFSRISSPPKSTRPPPRPQPSKMHQTNKTTQTAQRISMLFLSYRRATNERTAHPSSAPFFQTIVFYPWNRHHPYPCRRRRN